MPGMGQRFLALVLVLTPMSAWAVESRPGEAALADVKRIYVDQLGGGKTSDQFRDMLIAAIQTSRLYILTENSERADAILKGSSDDLIYTDEHNTNDSIGVHANAGSGSSSHALSSGVSSNQTVGIGVTDSEGSRIQERRHEATASVRIIDKDGDVLWSTTQESNGGKFRSALADIADKVLRNLVEATKKARDLAALNAASEQKATPPEVKLHRDPEPAPSPEPHP